MKSAMWGCMMALALAIPASLWAQAANGKDRNTMYYVFNLGAPGGGTAAMAATINNVGWISGDAFQAGNTSEHAELWLGTPMDLGTLGGTNSAIGWPNKNDHGMLAGISENGQPNPLGEDWSCALANFPTITNQICYGFKWQNGVMTALPPFAGGYDSYAASINNRGQVVGWAENGVHESTCVSPQVLQFEAVIWGPGLGQMTELPPLGDDLDGAATAINDKGQVVGISGICDQAVGRFSAKHAVLWQNGKPMDLGNFDGGMAWNTPTAINNRGQVAGFANQAGTENGAFNPVGFFWSKEQGLQQVAPVGTDEISFGWGVGPQGQVVGDSCDSTFSNCRAFIWQDGVSTDLNSLIQANSSLYLTLANDMNDSGEIVGNAIDSVSGDVVAFLAVPISGGNAKSASSDPVQQHIAMPDSLRHQLMQRVMGRLAGK